MKITVYYEDKNDLTVLEVPDEDCEIWVETDYQQRLAAADGKFSVTRRTPQEIMDEECNKPTFNNQHAETRRHASLETLDLDDCYLVGDEDVDIGLPPDGFEDLYKAMEKLLPRQRELLEKVFWDGFMQTEIARQEGVLESAVSQRMTAIFNRLRKNLESEK